MRRAPSTNSGKDQGIGALPWTFTCAGIVFGVLALAVAVAIMWRLLRRRRITKLIIADRKAELYKKAPSLPSPTVSVAPPPTPLPEPTPQTQPEV